MPRLLCHSKRYSTWKIRSSPDSCTRLASWVRLRLSLASNSSWESSKQPKLGRISKTHKSRSWPIKALAPSTVSLSYKSLPWGKRTLETEDWPPFSSSDTSKERTRSVGISTWHIAWRPRTSSITSLAINSCSPRTLTWVTSIGMLRELVTTTHQTSRPMQAPSKDYYSEIEEIERWSMWTPSSTHQATIRLDMKSMIHPTRK